MFLSAPPEVRLISAFARPFDNAVATARTCYAPRIITPEQVGGDHLDDAEKRERARQRRDDLAKSIYKAGHHTTLQHGTFQFALTNVSRQFIWSFLHSHPFYNSEQVSQRYVEMKPGNFAIPPLEGEAATVYERAIARQLGDYQKLIELLMPTAQRLYVDRFPGRGKAGNEKQLAKDVQKRCQEIARYVLPVATFAWMYHTISGLTLLRYWRLANAGMDCPAEAKLVVGQMVEQVLAHDPDYATIVQDPLPLEQTPEAQLMAQLADRQTAESRSGFAQRFDQALGGKFSALVAATPNAEAILAEAVREVVGAIPEQLPDDAAIRMVLDPVQNPLLGESLNLSLHSPLMRAGQHVHYTFRKKLSHTADSQDQRHRMTPGSRPMLAALTLDEPDYVVPLMIEQAEAGGGDGEAAATLYRESIELTWRDYRRLRALGASPEFAGYILPNAQAVRFTESGDLLALRHKFEMRLCFNAQEEIFRASLDEANAIRTIHPAIGAHLLPPCTLRHNAAARPICPEGGRFCGVKVWQYNPANYADVRGPL